MKMLAVALLALGLAAPAMAQVMVFDMGAKDSPVWERATQVTPEDARWQSTQGLLAHDSPAQGVPIWTNALNEDSVIGRTPNRFRFPATPGMWHVYVLAGVGADYREHQFWDFDVRVGKTTHRFQMISPERWGYAPQHHLFSVRSAGEIEVQLSPRTKWCLSGLVAWPARDDATAPKLIAELEQWAPAAERAKWHEEAQPPAGPAPALSAADKQRGFFVWHRHWATPIYPHTNPQPGELDPTLRIFAAPGEYEPLTFTVRPLRAVKQARIGITGLGPVPAANVEVRKVRFLPGRRGYQEQGLYKIIPDILDRWDGGALKANENATFWLTVHVPDGARPGLYRSQITFTADGRHAQIPVVLRVLDVTLQEDPEHDYGIYYSDPLRRAPEAPDEGSRQYWIRRGELERADLVAHGVKNVPLSCWTGPADANGKFESIDETFENLNQEVETARRFGFHPPFMVYIAVEGSYRKYMGEDLQSHLQGVKMPTEAFFSEISSLVRTIEAERVRRSWPEFYYQPYDEPSQNPEIVAFMARLCQAVQQGGGKVYVTASPERPAYQPMKPFVNVWCTQTCLPDYATVTADMQARDVQYWCYPNDVSGELEHTIVPGARMTYGFGFWRSGFRRLIPWMYQYNSGDPYNYLDGRTADFLVRSEPDGRPVPTAVWEAFREGYDDMRYIYSLKQAIAQAQASGSPAAKQEATQAQRVLDSVWQAVPVLPQYRFTGFWSPEEMDVYRWQIADRLERLTKRTRESEVTRVVNSGSRIGEMITIPAGSFLMGSDGSDPYSSPDELPQHSVHLPAYQIGKYQVTRGEYRKLIEAGGYRDPSYWSPDGWKWKESDAIDYAGMHGAVVRVVRPNGKEERSEPEHWAAEQDWGTGRFTQTDRHPVVGVTYYEAEAYCKWAGGRLPTEAEWEKAARWTGTRSTIWPWGDSWDPEKCNNFDDHSASGGGYRKLQSSPVGSYPDGASPCGCLDMVGNAYEWVADWHRSHPGSPNPFDRTNAYRFVKGGCWDDGASSNRCAYRGWYLPPSSGGTGPGDCDYIGFRVAR